MKILKKRSKNVLEDVFWENNLNMIDLCNIVSFDDVVKPFEYHYGLSPKGRKVVEKVFNQIKNFKKRSQKDKEEVIEVMCGGGYFIDEEGKIERFYCIHTNKYSLSFRKWSEVSNILIEKETLRRYKPEDIIAHFIWEVTWYGDETETAKVAKEIKGSVKKFNKDHEKRN